MEKTGRHLPLSSRKGVYIVQYDYSQQYFASICMYGYFPSPFCPCVCVLDLNIVGNCLCYLFCPHYLILLQLLGSRLQSSPDGFFYCISNRSVTSLFHICFDVYIDFSSCHFLLGIVYLQDFAALPWFLPYCFGKDAPEGTMVNRCRDLTQENVNNLVVEYDIPYSHLKQFKGQLSDEAKLRIAEYEEKLDTVLW